MLELENTGKKVGVEKWRLMV